MPLDEMNGCISAEGTDKVEADINTCNGRNLAAPSFPSGETIASLDAPGDSPASKVLDQPGNNDRSVGDQGTGTRPTSVTTESIPVPLLDEVYHPQDKETETDAGSDSDLEYAVEYVAPDYMVPGADSCQHPSIVEIIIHDDGQVTLTEVNQARE